MIKNSVCCIIVTYNIGSKFYDCYNAIEKQVEKVIIVDNGSNEETIEILQDLEKRRNTHVIYNDENLGIAEALNIGIEYSKNYELKWILTMDNDSIASDNMVNTMLDEYENIENNSDIVSVFPTYIDLGLNSIDSEDKKRKSEFKYVNGEITSGNLIKADVFKDIGGFEEKLFIDMVDFEFCFRLRSKGYKLIQLNKPVLYHNLGQMTVKNILGKKMFCSNHNYVRRYYITRNRFYLWKKYKEYNFEELNREKKFFVKDIIKILVLEEDKIRKIKMIIKGYRDYKKNIFGKLNG